MERDYNVTPTRVNFPCIIWFTGQPGSGKTQLGVMLSEFHHGFLIDGDELRSTLPMVSFTQWGRKRNVGRAQIIAKFLYSQSYSVCVAVVAPYRDQREVFKADCKADDVRLLEVYLHTESRIKKEFHVRDYQKPLNDHLDIDTGKLSIKQSVEAVHEAIRTLYR